jgi:predicted nucleic acid-binding protein
VKVLVDTSVWSLVLRRRSVRRANPLAAEIERLVISYRVMMVGPIRQELLSGIRSEEQYERLLEKLRAFPDVHLQIEDYELAARFFNQCRGHGVQGSNTDFLICAIAVRRDARVFSTDRDFEQFGRMLAVKLHEIGQ